MGSLYVSLPALLSKQTGLARVWQRCQELYSLPEPVCKPEMPVRDQDRWGVWDHLCRPVAERVGMKEMWREGQCPLRGPPQMAGQLGHWLKCLQGVHSSGVSGLKGPPLSQSGGSNHPCYPQEMKMVGHLLGDEVLPWL